MEIYYTKSAEKKNIIMQKGRHKEEMKYTGKQQIGKSKHYK